MSEPTLTDKIIAVAEYDGWTIERHPVFVEQYQFRKNGVRRNYEIMINGGFTYHTSLDSIAPVALNVMDKLGGIHEASAYLKIESMVRDFATLDPLAIFNATYEAIQVLKKYKS